MSHTSITSEETSMKCDCLEMNSLPFLDVLCSIKENKIVTDLYRKETDRNQYLLTSSCHPVECAENIPFSLALRIVRICSEIETREARFLELKQLLQEREYKTRMIKSAIEKARKDLKLWKKRSRICQTGDLFLWLPTTPGYPIYLLFKENIGEPWLVWTNTCKKFFQNHP